jgi:U3 small nucleolar RNA-associated protein 11
MSSLRNATKRVEKKERAQPTSRRSLGLLEKKKDYRLRAKNFHQKQSTLKKLKVKASLRNPDEFYFAMVNKKTKNGIHQDLANNTVSDDVLRLYRTQNVGFIDSKLVHEKHNLQQLQSSLHFIDEWKGKHTVFMDDDDDTNNDGIANATGDDNNNKQFNPSQYFNTAPELLETSISNRLTNEQLATLNNIPTKLNNKTEKAYRELERTLKRVEKLENAKSHLKLKRDLMGKGRRYKIKEAEGDKPAVFAWKSERKR